MKNLLLVFFCLLWTIESTGQQNNLYFVTAPAGLIVRTKPDLAAQRTGKLPYGSTVTILENTAIKLEIIDNQKPVRGNWVKIRYSNYPFIVNELDTDIPYVAEGYVFNGFLEKLVKASIETTEIDLTTFNKLFVEPKITTPTKITDIKAIEKHLGNKVTWKNIEYLGRTIDKITLPTKQVLNIFQMNNDSQLIAYYPTEEILLFEGGHSSEFSISLRTGESLETAGNPEYIIASPNGKYRLNGWFPGQECSSYFFQEQSGKQYKYLVNYGWDSDVYGSTVCYFTKFSWINDGSFVYSFTDNSQANAPVKYMLGKLIIK